MPFIVNPSMLFSLFISLFTFILPIALAYCFALIVVYACRSISAFHAISAPCSTIDCHFILLIIWFMPFTHRVIACFMLVLWFMLFMPCYLACICHSTCALYLLHTHISFMLIVWFVFVMQSLHVNSFLLVNHWCLSINLCNLCSSSCLGWPFSPCLLCGLYSLCLICAHCAVCACLAIYPTYWLYSGGLAV